MPHKIHFLQKNIVEVTAATIGIYKEGWKSIEDGAEIAVKARKIMEEKRYDILPIVSSSNIKNYFKTNKWNDYSSISRKQIDDIDIIDFQTPLKDLIHLFVSKSRSFFFLGQGAKVVGLISIVHLNSRHVKVYLFNLLSELEMLLSHFLCSKTTEKELLEMELGDINEENGNKNSYEESKQYYEKDQDAGVDLPFIEYLYLLHFIKIVAKKNLHLILGYPSKTKFNSDMGPLNKLRNKVAHPNRSVITEPDSVEKLWKQITKLENIISKLR